MGESYFATRAREIHSAPKTSGVFFSLLALDRNVLPLPDSNLRMSWARAIVHVDCEGRIRRNGLWRFKYLEDTGRHMWYMLDT